MYCLHNPQNFQRWKNYHLSSRIHILKPILDGTYTIKAYGAQGGTQTSFNNSVHGGGRGAIIQGDFSLSAGDVLKILVGQQPIDVAWLNGGGGGTFVIKN